MGPHKDQPDVGQWVDERLSALATPRDWEPDVAKARARLSATGERQSHGGRRWGWIGAGVMAAGLALLWLAPAGEPVRSIPDVVSTAPLAIAPDFSLADR